MQIDPNAQFVALKNKTTEITSSLTALYTRNDVREAAFYFFLAAAGCYIWAKELGVLLFVSAFALSLYLMRRR